MTLTVSAPKRRQFRHRIRRHLGLAARLDQFHLTPRRGRLNPADADRPFPRQAETIRSRDIDPDRPRPHAVAGDGEGHAHRLARLQRRNGHLPVTLQPDIAAGTDLDRIVARLLPTVVQRQRDLRRIARRHEARHRQIRQHRVAHGGDRHGVADLRRGPGHRHQAQPPVEIRDVERDFRRAIRPQRHDTRIKRRHLPPPRQRIGGDAAGPPHPPSA